MSVVSAARSLSVVPSRSSTTAPRRKVVTMQAQRKVVSVDKNWKKEFFGYGIFLEDSEISNDALNQIQNKKVLSAVEQSGLLSGLEKAGFTLSGLEDLKLLSLAESLGLLSLAEKVLNSNGAAIASSALIPFLLAFLSVCTLDEPAKYFVAAPLVIVAGGLFVTGNIVQGLMAEP